MILWAVLLSAFISASLGSEEVASQCQKDYLDLLRRHSEVVHRLYEVSAKHDKLQSRHLEVDYLEALINQKNAEIDLLKDQNTALRKSNQLREDTDKMPRTETIGGSLVNQLTNNNIRRGELADPNHFQNETSNVLAMPDRCPQNQRIFYAVNEIQVPGSDPIKVACYSNDKIGSGWMVVYRKANNSTYYNRTYEEYANGFGDVTLNALNYFFIGLERLHLLTSQDTYELDLGFTKCDHFVVGNRSEGYILKSTGGCTEYNGINLKVANFSTWDRDEDGNPDRNWAKDIGYGWWFDSEKNEPLTAFTLMIRRKD